MRMRVRSNTIQLKRKYRMIPNIELKFPKSDLDNYSVNKRLKIIFDSKKFFSEIEFQIDYKLLFGSEKDIKDARHLFRVFSDSLNKEKLKKHIKQLSVENLRKYTGEIYA